MARVFTHVPEALLCAVLACTPCAVLAAGHGADSARSVAPERVVIFVTDPARRPMPAVSLYTQTPGGSRVLIGTTDRSGHAALLLPRGASIFARGDGNESAPVVVSGATVALTLGIRTIGTVVTRAPSVPGDTGKHSVPAIISGDVTSALAFVPKYRSQAEGGSGNLELNGTPLSLPSGPGSSRFSVPSELISSFTPDQADDGSITPNFHLQSPTSTPQQELTLRSGSLGLAGVKEALTGPGYAFVVSDLLSEGNLAGESFADGSGRFYDHSTNQHQIDASADVEFRIGRARVSAVAFGSDRRNAALASVDPGTVPEGLGPGNFQHTRLVNGYVRASQTIGRDDWALLNVRYGGTASDDDVHALAAGTAIPSYSGFGYNGRYDQLSVTRHFDATSATLALSSTATTARSFANPYESVSKTSGTTFAFTTNRSNHNSSLATNLNYTRQAGPFTAAHIDGSLRGSQWSSNSRLNWSAYSAQSQVIETYYAQALRMSVPGAADYACSSHAAFASGASDVTPSAPHSAGVTADFTKTLRFNTRVTVGGFYGRTKNALVIASQAGGTALPAGYLEALNEQYAHLCGGSPLGASDVYLTHYVTVPERTDKEWYVSSTTTLGRVSFTLGYETYSALASGVPPPLPGTNGTLIDNAQIWNVPLHRGSAIVSYEYRGLTAGAGIAYAGRNNSAQLPANLIASAGVRLDTKRGAFTLSVQNLFNSYAGRFSTPALSTPAATTGAAVHFLGTPVPATWSLRYEVRTGQGKSS